MPEPFLYLEMDASGVNAQVIEVSFKKQVVTEQCRIRYQDLPGQEGAGSVEEPHPFDSALSHLASQIRLDACASAVVLISCLDVSFRMLSFPFKSENKIRQILPLELSTHLPQADTVYISDFQVLTLSGRGGHYPVLTASIPEPDIEIIFTGLARLGIRPAIVTPKGYASAIDFMTQHPQHPSFVFLDIGYHEACITLVEDHYPVLVRAFYIHSFQAAAIGGELKKTITGFLQRTGSRTKFDAFMASVHGDPAADHTPIDQALSGMGTDGIEPFKIISRPKRLSIQSPGRTPRFELNFCRGRFAKDSFFRRYGRNLSGTIAIAVMVLGIFLLGVFKEIRDLETGISKVEARMDLIFTGTFPGKRSIGDPLLQMQSLVKQARDKSGISEASDPVIRRPDYSAGRILYELSEKIPASIDIQVSRLLLNQDRVTLDGSTDNFNTVDQVKSYLDSSQIFKNVTIGSAAADKTGRRILFRFVIEL